MGRDRGDRPPPELGHESGVCRLPLLSPGAAERPRL